MHIQLQLDDVQNRGAERIEDPVHWPVYFALDDMALRSLAGDVAESSWMHTPGAAAAGSKLAWQYAFPDRAAPQSGRIGYGLLYSTGGASHASTQAAYQELSAIVRTLVLGHAARESGMAALLAAFGGRYAPEEPSNGVDLDRLRHGIDPQRLAGELDTGLLQGLDAFRKVAAALTPLATGTAAHAPAERQQPADADTDLLTKAVGKAEVLKSALGKRPSRLAPGTVVAVTLQAWRIDDIPSNGPFHFSRPLPARGVPRASLRLSGRLLREA